MTIHRTTTNKVAIPFFVAVFLLFFGAQNAFAADASIFLSPITGTYDTGTTFTLSVVVSSGGEAINAVEGKLEYDPKEFEIISINKDTSALSSWTVTPTFSNETGELSFAGLLATSTVLSRGEILKFNVKSLRTGELHIRFATGAAIHAADGTGGNILTQLNGGVYVTAPKENTPDSPVVEATSPIGEVLGAATGTEITSSTHPDQTAWYPTSTAVINWGVPTGTESILLSFDKRQNGVGTNPYPATTNEKIIRDNKDGIWYFHLTKISGEGTKETTSYRIAIDTTPPSSFVVSEVARKVVSDPNVSISLSATDTISGIDHYEFQFDGGDVSTWVDDGTHTHKITNVPVGTHQLSVFAVDKAGNRATGHITFTVENLPTPSLTLMNKALIEGDKLQLTIASVPNAKLDINISRANASPVTEEFTVDGNGMGIFTSALPLAPGSYSVSLVAHTADMAISKESAAVLFEVNSSFLGVMKRHPMIPVALIGIILLIAFSYYFWRRLYGKNHGDSDEEVEEDVYSNSEEVQNSLLERESENEIRPKSPRTISQGAVVLEKRKKIEIPATRL